MRRVSRQQVQRKQGGMTPQKKKPGSASTPVGTPTAMAGGTMGAATVAAGTGGSGVKKEPPMLATPIMSPGMTNPYMHPYGGLPSPFYGMSMPPMGMGMASPGSGGGGSGGGSGGAGGENEILYQYCATILEQNPNAAASIPPPTPSPVAPPSVATTPVAPVSKKRKKAATSTEEKKESAAATATTTAAATGAATAAGGPKKRAKRAPAASPARAAPAVTTTASGRKSKRSKRAIESEEEAEEEEDPELDELLEEEDSDEDMLEEDESDEEPEDDTPARSPPPKTKAGGKAGAKAGKAGGSGKPLALNTESGLISLATLASPSVPGGRPLTMDFTPSAANGINFGLSSLGHLIPPTPISSSTGGSAFPLASPASSLMQSFAEGDPISSPHVNPAHLSTLQYDEAGRMGRFVQPQVFQFEDGTEGGGAGGSNGATQRLDFQHTHVSSPSPANSGAGSGGVGAQLSASPSSTHSLKHLGARGTAGGHFLEFLQSPSRSSPRHLQKTPNSAGSAANSPPPSTATATNAAAATGSAGAALASRSSTALGLPPLQTPPKLSSHSTGFSAAILTTPISSSGAHLSSLSAGGTGGGHAESSAPSSMPPTHPTSAGGMFSPMAQLTQTLTSNIGRNKAQTSRLLHAKDESAGSSALMTGMSPRNAFFSPSVSPRNILSSSMLHSPSVGGHSGAMVGASRSGNNSRSTSPFRSSLHVPQSSHPSSSTSPLPSPARHLNIGRSYSPPASPSNYQQLLANSAHTSSSASNALLALSPFTTQRKIDAPSGATLQSVTAAALDAAQKEGSPESKRMDTVPAAAATSMGAPAAPVAAPSAAPSTSASPPLIQPNPANAPRSRRFDWAIPPAKPGAATPANASAGATATPAAAAGKPAETPSSYMA